MGSTHKALHRKIDSHKIPWPSLNRQAHWEWKRIPIQQPETSKGVYPSVNEKLEIHCASSRALAMAKIRGEAFPSLVIDESFPRCPPIIVAVVPSELCFFNGEAMEKTEQGRMLFLRYFCERGIQKAWGGSNERVWLYRVVPNGYFFKILMMKLAFTTWEDVARISTWWKTWSSCLFSFKDTWNEHVERRGSRGDWESLPLTHTIWFY